MKLIISIVGFGNIGKTIAPLLLNYKIYSFHINIVDTDSKVKGAILDVEHAAELTENHKVSFNNEELLNNSDFIFHCAGASVPKGKSRLVSCQASIEITEAVFLNYKPYKKPFIIVVANPVEIISYITQKITALPKENIIGTGTLLDSIRMNYSAKQMNGNISKVDSILLGEHGSTAFLSEQLSTVDSIPFHSFFDTSKVEKLMGLVKSSASEIKETQKATIYGVGFCAIQIFESLLSSEVRKFPISTFIPESLSNVLGESKIYLSLLSELSSKGSQPVKSYRPDKKEIDYLKDSIHIIKSCIPSKYV